MIRDRAPRLPKFNYAGLHRYHVRVTTWNQRRYFENGETTTAVREQLLKHASQSGFNICAYCFMPDHVHLFVQGESESACLTDFVKRWKQATGYEYCQQHRQRLWQPGYFDRVLREQESSDTVARYILENPVRARLAERIGEYPFAWCRWTAVLRG